MATYLDSIRLGFSDIFTEKATVPMAGEIIKRMTNCMILVVYPKQSLAMGKKELLLRPIHSIKKYPHVLEMINKYLVDPVFSWWVKRYIKIMSAL